MKQLELLTIRQQPLQRVPEVPSRVIQAYVRENLRDFPKRQKERERARKELREKYEQPPKPRTQPTMRTIKVTYRAIFEQPTGILNPLGMRLPGTFPIELFQWGKQWQAREIATARRNVYERLGKFVSLDHARREVEQSFERRLQDWQIWGTPLDGPGIGIERMLTPYDISDLGNGQFGWVEPEDRTHIMNPQWTGPERVPPSACGLKLNAKVFISHFANIRPTCKGCADIWEREYKGR